MTQRRDQLKGLWTRLAGMSWDEIHTRAGQEFSKRWDATVYHLGGGRAGERQQPMAARGASFFFQPEDIPRVATILYERLPQETGQIIAQAEQICRHRFDLLGYDDLHYGQEIDWHLDVVHGKRAPRRPWYKIRFLDFDQFGDHKIIWELNRHQHLVTLIKAYHLTRDERFARELAGQWYHWQRENPYPIGINWASSLEVAFRSLAWLWVYHLLAGCPALPQHFGEDLLRALALHARHIRCYLSTYFSPNTHLLGEGVALYFLGTLCSQFASAERWQSLGWRIILREAERQVQADGMHFEQSVYYHVYALDFFLHARCLAACNQAPLPSGFDRKIENMLEILAGISQAGVTPRLGDDDGGRVFNPRRNRAQHLLDPLALGAAVFGRADFKAASPGLTEEMIWLLGAQGVAKFDQLRPLSPSVASIRYEPSGLCVMADSEPVRRQLLIDAGPQGHGNAGHGHADALGIQVAVNGQELLSDAGTFCYVPSNKRDHYRGTSAHNTLCVDGLDQAESNGRFSWRALPEVRTRRWVAGKTFDLFEGSHTGYTRLPIPMVHRRWIFNLKSRFWMVRDRVEGEGQHSLDIRWHAAPALGVQHMDSKVTVLAGDDKAGLAFLSPDGHGWSKELSRGNVSPVYGREESDLVLSFHRQAQLPAEMAILLLPLGFGSGETGTLTQATAGPESVPVHCFFYEMQHECSHIFFAECNRRWEFGPWSSDAAFLYCGVVPREGSVHWVLCEGSYIDAAGQRVVTCSRPVERWECVCRGTERLVFCSEESAVTQVLDNMIGRCELLRQCGRPHTQGGRAG